MVHSRSEWLKTKAPLQALSLLIAIVAWFVVNSGQTVLIRRSVRLQYIQLPKDLVFQRIPLKEVKVDLTGSLYRLRGIPDDELVYLIDLSNGKPGAFRVELDLENLHLPLDIEASHFNPRSFNIHLEEVHSQFVKLKPEFIGKPKEGFQVGSVKIKPEAVAITGPKSLISKISELEVEIPLMNRERSFSENIKPRMSFIHTETVDAVQVEVEIIPQKSRREFSSVPVAMVAGKTNVKISPTKGKVVLEGPDSEIRDLESKLEISVSVDRLKRGRYRLRGQVSLPQKVKLISIEPESFLVEVLQDGGRR